MINDYFQAFVTYVIEHVLLEVTNVSCVLLVICENEKWP